VLLRPEDVWVELWLPAAQRGGQHDVRALAYQVGEWWAAALRTLGVETTMHRGGVQDAAEGAVACFAGVGPGELCVDGDKLLGLSQWRARQGTLVSSVVGVRSPQDLARYLALPRRAPHLERSVGLGELTAAVEVDDLVDAFATAVSHDVPTVRVEAGLFS
jgi:lipoate-protein ligase A